MEFTASMMSSRCNDIRENIKYSRCTKWSLPGYDGKKLVFNCNMELC